MENHDNCVYDYVEIRDGHGPEATLLGTYCGYKVPADIRSTSNKLQVKFVSDATVQKPGFSASFMVEIDECKTTAHGCEHECVNTLGTYECSCKIGYELHSDGKHCEGKTHIIAVRTLSTVQRLTKSVAFNFQMLAEECWKHPTGP